MQAFDFIAPKSVDEAISALAAGGDKALPLSGGTDLIAQLQEGRRDLETVVDLKRISQRKFVHSLPSLDTSATRVRESRVLAYRVWYLLSGLGRKVSRRFSRRSRSADESTPYVAQLIRSLTTTHML